MVDLKEWQDMRRFTLTAGENIKVLINDNEQYNFDVKQDYEADIFFRLIETKPEV